MRVADAVERRNYFIHHFFRESFKEQPAEAKRRSIVEEIRATESEFDQLNEELMERYRGWLAKQGVQLDDLNGGPM